MKTRSSIAVFIMASLLPLHLCAGSTPDPKTPVPIPPISLVSRETDRMAAQPPVVVVVRRVKTPADILMEGKLVSSSACRPLEIGIKADVTAAANKSLRYGAERPVAVQYRVVGLRF